MEEEGQAPGEKAVGKEDCQAEWVAPAPTFPVLNPRSQMGLEAHWGSLSVQRFPHEDRSAQPKLTTKDRPAASVPKP